jgi:uncharacterized protein YbbC (DUF1343 family)
MKARGNDRRPITFAGKPGTAVTSKHNIRLPVDQLPNLWPKVLKGAKIGAVLHPASVSASLVHTADVLKSHDGDLFRLGALFGPQHGYLGQTQDNMIEWTGFEHPQWGIPVYSLYGEHREPTDGMLKGLDALLVDLQDVGARYYTFIWTLYLCMKAAARNKIPVVVLDRPNPIGSAVEGPVLDPNYRSFVGLHPIPVRHGKTIGELALQFKAEAFPDCEVVILPMENHDPGVYFEDTGLPWVLPSPNMPTVDTAVVYPGMCLFEATNVSEARGTTKPFELFGAPWIDARDLCAKLNKERLPGVFFREAYFQPTFHKFKGELCGGAQFHVTERKSFLPWWTTLSILNLLREDYGEHFRWKEPPYEYEHTKLPIEILIGGKLDSVFPEIIPK